MPQRLGKPCDLAVRGNPDDGDHMPAKLVDPRGQTWQHLDGFGIDAMHADIVFDELHAKIRVVDEIVRIAGISVGVAGSPDEDRLLGRATLCES